MTLSGSKVEVTGDLGAEISNVVVGRIQSMERHPDSDHMWICQLDVGKERAGADRHRRWNIHVGDLVPVALHKSTLPGGVKITKGKLRGVPSNGMMCSFQELGLSHGCVPYACENGIPVPARPAPRLARTSRRCSVWTTGFPILRLRPTARTA